MPEGGVKILKTLVAAFAPFYRPEYQRGLYRFTAWFKFKRFGDEEWNCGKVVFRPFKSTDHTLIQEWVIMKLNEDFLKDGIPLVSIALISKEEYESMGEFY